MRAILIASLLVSLALAGCAADDGAGEPTTNETPTNTTNETAPEEEPEPDCVAPPPAPCVEPPTRS